MEQYRDVEKFVVSDFSNVGFPQLGIWTKNDKESLTPSKIVHFKEYCNMCSDDCNISNILHEKYQVWKFWNDVLQPLVTFCFIWTSDRFLHPSLVILYFMSI
jgi:hypothetical protein